MAKGRRQPPSMGNTRGSRPPTPSGSPEGGGGGGGGVGVGGGGGEPADDGGAMASPPPLPRVLAEVEEVRSSPRQLERSSSSELRGKEPSPDVRYKSVSQRRKELRQERAKRGNGASTGGRGDLGSGRDSTSSTSKTFGTSSSDSSNESSGSGSEGELEVPSYVIDLAKGMGSDPMAAMLLASPPSCTGGSDNASLNPSDSAKRKHDVRDHNREVDRSARRSTSAYQDLTSPSASRSKTEAAEESHAAAHGNGSRDMGLYNQGSSVGLASWRVPMQRENSPDRAVSAPEKVTHATLIQHSSKDLLQRFLQSQANSGTRDGMASDTSENGASLNKIPQSWESQSGDLKGVGEEQFMTLYPYTHATYVPQEDVIEEGVPNPPEPHAGLPAMQMELVTQVKSVRNLPNLRDGGNGSHYMVELSFMGNVQRTMVTERNETYNHVHFKERFSFAVHEMTISLARAAKSSGCDGPTLVVTVYDCGRYSHNDLVGRCAIAIHELLPADKPKNVCRLDTSQYLYNNDGSQVCGSEGESTTCSLSFRSRMLRMPDWKPPKLEDTLRACENTLDLKRKSVMDQEKEQDDDSMRSNNKDKHGAEGGRDTGLSFIRSSIADLHEDDVGIVDTDSVNVDKRIHYWKERLEKTMDSLYITVVVISLVCVDIGQLVYFQFVNPVDDQATEPLPQVVLTIFVLTCFLAELLLRQVAKGRRFWGDIWNLFDFVVVWVSVTMIVAKYSVDGIGSTREEQEFGSEVSSINMLRILSRVAVGMRVMRVLINLRRARKLSGHVTQALRTTISQNRRRYKKHGFDLDLTYITNRIIAMSAPAFGGHSAYRNDIHIVSRFLSFRHYGHFWIFNLCDTYLSSDGVMGNYNHNMLFSQVLRIPFEDHAPPLISEMLQFCDAASKFMQQDPLNVVAVHCKGGKGRTGVFIAALMLWTGHRRSALDALELFTFRRTENYDAELGLEGSFSHYRTTGRCNQTVEGPSQIRYVHYLEAILYSGVDPYSYRKFVLTSLNLFVGTKQVKKPWHVSVTIKCNRSIMYDSQECLGDVVFTGEEEGDIFEIPLNVVVWGDVRIDFYVHTDPSKRFSCMDILKKNNRKLFFFSQFNTAFYAGKTEIEFGKLKLDMLSKDRHHIKTDSNFKLKLKMTENLEGHSHVRVESEMRGIFRKFSRSRRLAPGERYSFWREDEYGHRSINQMLVLVTDGHLEGVVEEVASDGASLDHHPLGREVGCGSNACVRNPNMLCSGINTVLGAAPFLLKVPCTDFVAGSRGAEIHELSHSNQPDLGAFSPASSLATPSKVMSRIGMLEDPGNCIIEGMAPEQLLNFYRGLAINISTQLSRSRLEAIRISECRAFNDRQTVLRDQDETEQLRVGCIKRFNLPMTEKVTMIVKVSVKAPDFRCRNCRVIFLYNFIVLDPEYYGPEIAPHSRIIPVRQLRGVNPGVLKESEAGKEATNRSLIMTIHGARIQGLDIIANVIRYGMIFHETSQAARAYALLSNMCRRAEDMREREKFKPFDSPALTRVLEVCSSVYTLKKGEVLVEARANDSLFLVRTGEVRLMTQRGDIFRLVREGECFGETTFALQSLSGFAAEANVPSVVLEIRQAALKNQIKADPMLGAQFYFILSEVIAKNLNETVEETFPGSWTARSNNDGPLIAADCEKSAMTMRFSSVARTAFTSDELKTLVDKTSNETTSMRQLDHDDATDENHLPLPARRNGSGGDLAEGLLCSV